jgi:fumarate hydratase, class II
MPIEIIYAMAILKKASAKTNVKLETSLTQEKAQAICQACDEILEGKFDDQFPLVVWQTGSGTQSNMNVNEVIANRATEILGGDFRAGNKLVSANDDVNKSQSSNDTFPTAMHIAIYSKLTSHTLPKLRYLQQALHDKSVAFESIVKIGRTHLMDATPLTLGQEFSGYVTQIQRGVECIEGSLCRLAELALGGTAVGTGLNTPPGYAVQVAGKLLSLLANPSSPSSS